VEPTDGPGPEDLGPDAPLYPVSLRVAGRPCLVVGGGPVATRKVDGLVACRAAVTVVAPAMDPRLVELARTASPPLHLERRPYRTPEAGGYRLVVTATGRPEVDRAVAADAEAAGVWVNSADDPDHCAYFLPSVHRDGPVTVAVSTGGTSPALARWLRRRAAVALGSELGTLARLIGDARRRLHAAGRSTEDLAWDELFDGPFGALVRQGALDEARAVLDTFTDPAGPAG
jgi:siroheme synthase-like protein